MGLSDSAHPGPKWRVKNIFSAFFCQLFAFFPFVKTSCGHSMKTLVFSVQSNKNNAKHPHNESLLDRVYSRISHPATHPFSDVYCKQAILWVCTRLSLMFLAHNRILILNIEHVFQARSDKLTPWTPCTTGKSGKIIFRTLRQSDLCWLCSGGGESDSKVLKKTTNYMRILIIT